MGAGQQDTIAEERKTKDEKRKEEKKECLLRKPNFSRG